MPEHETTPAAPGAPRPPRHRVAPRARTYWLLSRATVLVVGWVLTLVPAALWEGGRTWLLVAAGALTVLLLPAVVLAPWLRYRTHRWEATGTAVYSRTGWLGREWRIAPLSRVQTVEAKRNLLHRALGLAAVSVTTGSAQGAVQIEGLQAEVAEDLVTQLTDAVARTQGDAT
ncbi:PH domain-containing protein [Oceanitalea stevensii]|uniref:PH domain-containing protein n=1 Tax=Oceanitalea stevensii TaxID=2763072 RepID=A0ABR8Z5K0_9MICO|nr:PH domain-containing protein [Oceanitalea stevensii]MBD8063283.1 PH domain-containing protein [Oceanitalea stevensii]